MITGPEYKTPFYIHINAVTLIIMPRTPEEKKMATALAQRRFKSRKKAESLNQPIPSYALKQKTGSKVRCNATSKGDASRKKRRLQYRLRKQRTRVINVIPERKKLRPRRLTSTSGIRERGEVKIMEASDLLHEGFGNLCQAQDTMSKVSKLISENFCWYETTLFFVVSSNGEKSLHPWVEVKKSPITNSAIDGGFSYGLFAARNFKKDSFLGVYLGRVLLAKTEEHIDSVFKASVGDGLIQIDIDDQTESRLRFGMGFHMMNDNKYEMDESGYADNTNNALLLWDLSVHARCEILDGEK